MVIKTNRSRGLIRSSEAMDPRKFAPHREITFANRNNSPF